LAGHLGKTLDEIDAMSSREFSIWLAYSRWFRPLDDSWMQTGMILTGVLAPYSKTTPKPEDFVPIEHNTPQHPTQVAQKLKELAAELSKWQPSG
jgi:hypothetical protein